MHYQEEELAFENILSEPQKRQSVCEKSVFNEKI